MTFRVNGDVGFGFGFGFRFRFRLLHRHMNFLRAA
jgi:hypothetical protein